MTVDYIQQYHVTYISWHTTLNNHASTRPKAYGGKLVDSVTACKAFEQSLPGHHSLRSTWDRVAAWDADVDDDHDDDDGDHAAWQAEMPDAQSE